MRLKRLFTIAAVLIGPAVMITVWRQPALCRVRTLIALLSQESPSKLPIPVTSVASRDLVDTWGAPRSHNRRHEGIDIFAPLGQPVTSTTKGVVFKVGKDNLGGNVVVVVGPGWDRHYYAHLDRFAEIKPGMIVQKGTILGYVGNTGNAIGTPHHLHYGVYRFLGGATNPYPLLVDDRRELANPRARRVKNQGQRRNQARSQRAPRAKRTATHQKTRNKNTERQRTRELISRMDTR